MAFLVFCRLNYMLAQSINIVECLNTLKLCSKPIKFYNSKLYSPKGVTIWSPAILYSYAYLMQCSHQTVYDFALSTINTRGLNFKKDLQILLSGMLIKRRKNEPKSMLRTQEGIGSRPMLKQILCGTVKMLHTIFMK